MPDLTEKTLKRNEVYAGRIIRVRRDEVLLPGGGHGLREVVEHPGGVGILAFDDRGRVALVRQYRYAVGEHLWEIPAGKREAGEAPFVTAQRELAEEVGATASRWTDLGQIIASPGCYGEVLYLYMARGSGIWTRTSFWRRRSSPLPMCWRGACRGRSGTARPWRRC